MALLKKINGLSYQPNVTDPDTTQPAYFQSYANSTNFALAEDENNSILYIGGNAYDSTSLVPFFDKECRALAPLKKNNYNWYTNSALNTRYPQALAMHDDYIHSDPSQNSIFPMLLEPSKFSNLDGSTIPSSTKVYEYQGETYTFMLTPEFTGAAIWRGDEEKISIIVGSDLENPQSIITSPELLHIQSSYYGSNISILHVDMENRTIYCLSTRTYDSRSSSDTRYHYLDYIALNLFAIPFALPSDGNPYIGPIDATNLLIPNVGQYSASNSILEQILYCGLDAFDNHIFCRINGSADPIEYNFYVINNSSGSASVVRTISLTANNYYLNMMHPYQSQFIYNPLNKMYESITLTTTQNGTFNPFLIQWDKTLDSSLTTTTPIEFIPLNIDDVSSVNYDAANIFFIAGVRFSFHTKAIYSVLNNIEYLTILPVFRHNTAVLNAQKNNISALNMHCYKIVRDPSTNLPSLEFVSSTPTTNIDYYLTSNNTVINSIDSEGLSFYSLTPGGWVKTNTEQGVFTAMTYDSFGRTWALEIAGKQQAQWPIRHTYLSGTVVDPELKLHLITNSIAYSTTIEFGTTGQEYAGVTLNNTIKVNAYDNVGQRISTDVVVSIEGSNMTFQDGSTTTTTTTSAIQDTSLPVLITGPGYINVTASFAI
jgi:hypothetical protein